MRRAATHLAAAIAHAREAAGDVVRVAIVPDLLDHLRRSYAPESPIPFDALFDEVREAGLLVLDDLGAQSPTAWATEKLFQIVNYRYNYRMPLVVTTNARLESRMDERVRSRLADRGLARWVTIAAPDYRRSAAAGVVRVQAQAPVDRALPGRAAVDQVAADGGLEQPGQAHAAEALQRHDRPGGHRDVALFLADVDATRPRVRAAAVRAGCGFGPETGVVE